MSINNNQKTTSKTTIKKTSETKSQKRLDQFIRIIDNIEKDILPLKQKHNEIMQLLNWNKDNLMINENTKEEEKPSNEETQSKNDPTTTTVTTNNQMEFQKPFIPHAMMPPTATTGILPPLPDFLVTVKDNKNQKKNMAFDEILKLKRDLKRRSLKYKQLKTPPLTYTEEIRALIHLQFEGWNQFLLASEETPLELKDL